MTSWTEELTRARLHVVSGKGGTGKTTVAAALALALAADGRSVLLVETEGRQGIAQLFDLPPMLAVLPQYRRPHRRACALPGRHPLMCRRAGQRSSRRTRTRRTRFRQTDRRCC